MDNDDVYKLTNSLFKLQQIAELNGGKCLSEKYEGVFHKYSFQCGEEHPPWQATADSIFHGRTWCPTCKGNATFTLEEAQAVAKKHDPEGRCLATSIISGNTEVEWECGKGHKWPAKPSKVKGTKNRKGTWCPTCANNQRKTLEAEQAWAKGRGWECISSAYINNRIPLTYRCANGHEFPLRPDVARDRKECPVCKELSGINATLSRHRHEGEESLEWGLAGKPASVRAGKTFALRLRTARFAPHPRQGSSRGYPRPIECGYFGDEDRGKAYVLAYDGKYMEEYIQTFKRSALEDGMPSYLLEEHKTLKRLKSHYPSTPASESDKDSMRFVHYERIGIYDRRSAFIGLAHVRYLLTVPHNFSVYEYHVNSPLSYTPRFTIQILDAWAARDSVLQARDKIAAAIASEALEHVSRADKELLDPEDTITDMTSLRWPVIIEAGEGETDAMLVASATAGCMMQAASADFPDEIGLYFSDLMSSCLVGAMPRDDIEEVERALTIGRAVLPIALSRGAVGDIQHFLIVPDESFVVTGPGKIGHARSDATGVSIQWYFLIDDASRLFYVEPVFPGEAIDIKEFLHRAWRRDRDLIFEGKPKALSVPKSYMKELHGLKELLSQEGIELRHPRSGFGSGIATAKTWHTDVCWFARHTDRVSPPSLMEWCRKHQIVIAGCGLVDNSQFPSDLAADEFGKLPETHWSQFSAINTRLFATTVSRTDAEDVIRDNWPVAREGLRVVNPPPSVQKTEPIIDLASLTPNMRLRVLRNIACLTGQEFASVLGFAKAGSVTSLELGNRVFREDEVQKIAEFFHVTEGWLRDGSIPIFQDQTVFFNMQPRNDDARLAIQLHLRENLAALIHANGYEQYIAIQIINKRNIFKGFLLFSGHVNGNRLVLRITDGRIYSSCKGACQVVGIPERTIKLTDNDLIPEQLDAIYAIDSDLGSMPTEERVRRINTLWERLGVDETQSS